MSDTTFIVNLDVRDRGDRLSVISAEVPGLHLYGHDMHELREVAMHAVKDLFKRNRNLDVMVTPTDELTQLRVRPVEQPC